MLSIEFCCAVVSAMIIINTSFYFEICIWLSPGLIGSIAGKWGYSRDGRSGGTYQIRRGVVVES